MKKNVLRAVSLLLLLPLCLAVFAGCSPRKATIFTVNGEAIQYDDVMMHLFFQKYSFFSSKISEGTMTIDGLYELDASFLSTKISDELTIADYFFINSTNSALSAELCRQLAKENKLKITSSDKDTLKESRNSFKTSLGGAQAFNAFLDKSGSTADAYERYLENTLYMAKLLTLFSDGGKYALTDEEKAQARADYEEKYITTRHMIFYTINTSTSSSLSEAEIEKQRERAEAALARLKNGESFDTVRKDSDNPSENPLTFTTGEMITEYEEAAFALQVGDYSEIVQSKYGFHIIIREELSSDKYSDYYQSVIYAKFQAYLTEHSDAAKIVFKDKNYDKLAADIGATARES